MANVSSSVRSASSLSVPGVSSFKSATPTKTVSLPKAVTNTSTPAQKSSAISSGTALGSTSSKGTSSYSPAKSTAIQSKVSSTPSYSSSVPKTTTSSYSGGGGGGGSNVNAQRAAIESQLASLKTQLAQQQAQEAQQQQQPIQQPYSQNPTQSVPEDGLYSQLIKQLAEKSQQESKPFSQQMGLYNQYNQALQNSMFNQAETEAGIEKRPIPLEFQQGMKQVTQGQYAKQQAALGSAMSGASNALSAANTQQGLQQQGLTSAMQGASPASSQIVLTPGQTAYSALGNQPQTATAGLATPTGMARVNATVQNLANLVASNNLDYQTAYNQLGQYGVDVANSLLPMIQSIKGGTFNPVASSAIMNQNAQQGATYQGQATEMDTALKQVDTIKPALVGFLQSSGLNSQQNPSINEALKSYYGEFLNPANKAIFEQYIGDIKKYTGQILAAGSGTIPTDVANTLASFDPSDLNAQQLESYLDNLSVLGHNQLSVLQGQASASYGGQGGYSGTPAVPNQTPINAPANTSSAALPTTSNMWAQAGIGTLLNLVGGVKGVIGGLAGKVLK